MRLLIKPTKVCSGTSAEKKLWTEEHRFCATVQKSKVCTTKSISPSLPRVVLHLSMTLSASKNKPFPVAFTCVHLQNKQSC